jgi:hypothetical protein
MHNIASRTKFLLHQDDRCKLCCSCHRSEETCHKMSWGRSCLGLFNNTLMKLNSGLPAMTHFWTFQGYYYITTADAALSHASTPPLILVYPAYAVDGIVPRHYWVISLCYWDVFHKTPTDTKRLSPTLSFLAPCVILDFRIDHPAATGDSFPVNL